jgi:hypothetical protein
MSHTHTHRGNYDLLQAAMRTTEGAENLGLRLKQAVAAWLGDALPGRLASAYDDDALLLAVLGMFKSHCQSVPAQAQGGRYGMRAGTEHREFELEFAQDETYTPCISQVMALNESEDTAGAHEDPRADRVREAIEGVTRTGADTGTAVENFPVPEQEQAQCLAGMRNLRISGAGSSGSSGASSDISSLRSRRNRCNARRAGTYACRIRGCDRYG